MTSFEKILFDELGTEDIKDVNLAEGIFSINPMLAYYTFKRKSLKNLRKISDKTVGKATKSAKDFKRDSTLTREKIRAELGHEGGKDANNTVYKLTKQQTEVLSEIYEKYGKELVNEIMRFRREVLAPYQVIKRTVKKNKMLTSKETLGMTKEEFKSALESGRRKIEARGGRFENLEELKDKIEKQEKVVKDLETVKEGIKTNKRIPPTILERILKEFELGKNEFSAYSMNDLKKAYFEIRNNIEKIGELGADDSMDDTERAKEINKLVKRNIDLRKGRVAKAAARKRYELKKAERGYGDEDEDDLVGESTLLEYKLDLTKNKNFRLSNGGFNSALGLYFLRRNIIQELKPEKPDSVYRETYYKIVDQLIKEARDKRKTYSDKIIKNKTNTEFNERERKIWELRPSVGRETGDLKDYIQKIKEEDFFNPIYYKKTEKLSQAERKIEAEIKKFERALKKIISDEDYKKLKQYRLINNLITVGEMSSPEKLFKDVKEFEVSVQPKKDFISDEDFKRRIIAIYKNDYDTISELNSAKKKAEQLFKDKKAQGDDEVADELESVLTKIKNRRQLKAGAKDSDDVVMNDVDRVDADIVEKEARKIINRNYQGDYDEFKQDLSNLNKLIKKYKEEDPTADENLEEIDFLITKAKNKLRSAPTPEELDKEDEDKDYSRDGKGQGRGRNK